MTEKNKPPYANALLGLLAETSIHAGAGGSVGAIDLPIQREAHTDWPCVFGSAVKGALRTLAEDRMCTEETGPNGRSGKRCTDEFYAVFGPDTGHASDHAGALLVGDARLVLLPVRSLTTHFKWVTCPALLDRLRRDTERLGVEGFSDLRASQPRGTNDDLSPAWSASAEEDIYLEEYRFEAKLLPGKDKIVPALSQLSDRDEFKEALERQLVVVGDDVFRDLCRHATPVNTHIRLDSESKTTIKGALWYEETLPSETLLYVAISAGAARRRIKDKDGEDVGPMQLGANEVLIELTKLFSSRAYLQLGGNETVGMGWCGVTPLAAASKGGD